MNENNKQVTPGQKLLENKPTDPVAKYMLKENEAQFKDWLKKNSLADEDFSRLDMEWYAEQAWMEQAKRIEAITERKLVELLPVGMYINLNYIRSLEARVKEAENKYERMMYG